jgi:hypothetical protein
MNVHHASLDLYQGSSGSCTATPADVYAVTEPWTGPSTQAWPGPAVDTSISYGSFVSGAGANGSCPAGHAVSDVSRLIEYWANDSLTNQGISIRARDEDSTSQYKEFASAQSSNPPTLTVVWTDPLGASAPDAPNFTSPTGPVSTATPTLTADYSDDESQAGTVRFLLYDAASGAFVESWTSSEVSSGSTASVTIGSPSLELGREYTYQAYSRDSTSEQVSGLSGHVPITWAPIFLTTPTEGSAVSSTVSVVAELDSSVTGATSVSFHRDGTLLGTDTSAPYSVSWDPSGLPEGEVELTATINGGSESGEVSPSVFVDVDYAADGEPNDDDTDYTGDLEVEGGGQEAHPSTALHALCTGSVVRTTHSVGSSYYHVHVSGSNVFFNMNPIGGNNCGERYPFKNYNEIGHFNMRLIRCDLTDYVSSRRTFTSRTQLKSYLGTNILAGTCYRLYWYGSGKAVDRQFKGVLWWYGDRV